MRKKTFSVPILVWAALIVGTAYDRGGQQFYNSGFSRNRASPDRHNPTLGIERLVALIEPDNAPSEQVAVKVGMQCKKEILRPGGAARKLYAAEKEDAYVQNSVQ